MKVNLQDVSERCSPGFALGLPGADQCVRGAGADRRAGEVEGEGEGPSAAQAHYSSQQQRRHRAQWHHNPPVLLDLLASHSTYKSVTQLRLASSPVRPLWVARLFYSFLNSSLMQLSAPTPPFDQQISSTVRWLTAFPHLDALVILLDLVTFPWATHTVFCLLHMNTATTT